MLPSLQRAKDTVVQRQGKRLSMRHSEGDDGEVAREGGRAGGREGGAGTRRRGLIREANHSEQQRESLGGR